MSVRLYDENFLHKCLFYVFYTVANDPCCKCRLGIGHGGQGTLPSLETHKHFFLLFFVSMSCISKMGNVSFFKKGVNMMGHVGG